MKIYHKENHCPQAGDKRTRSGFLFFPTRIKNITRWLETASWVEEYVYEHFDNDFDVAIYKWVKKEWYDI